MDWNLFFITFITITASKSITANIIIAFDNDYPQLNIRQLATPAQIPSRHSSIPQQNDFAYYSTNPLTSSEPPKHFKMCTRQVINYNCGHSRDMGVVTCSSPSTCGGVRLVENDYAGQCESH